MKTEPEGGRRKLNRRKEVTEWMRCDAGGWADMAGALSRIKKKGLAPLAVLAGQTWQAF